MAKDWTPPHLRAHAQRAVELELFTIPAYLCAYYSIDAGSSAAAARAADALLGVVNEEMMHLQQVCNLANALGRSPVLTGAAAPVYPGRVPYNRHDVEVTLGPATRPQIEAFMALELPTFRDPYHSTPGLPPMDRYETIGELYHSLANGLIEVYGNGDEPWPLAVHHQITGNFTDDSFPITDLASAIKALDLVVLQGEGTSASDGRSDDPRELAHYYRLQLILDTLGPGDLRPMISHTPDRVYGPRAGKLLDLLDACYSDLLRRLEAAFHGEGDVRRAVGMMFASVNALSFYVVQTPFRADDEPAGEGTLCPRFTYTEATPEQAYGCLDKVDLESEVVQGVAAALKLGGG